MTRRILMVMIILVGLITPASADNRILPTETWISVPDSTPLKPGEELDFTLDETHFLTTRAGLANANAAQDALERCVKQREEDRAEHLEDEVEKIVIPWPKWKWAAAGAGVVATFFGGVWIGTKL